MDFSYYVFEKIKNQRQPEDFVSLRTLDKSFKSEFQKLLKNANVKIEDLKKLACSNLSDSIHFLNVKIANNLEYIDDLQFSQLEYFQNIKSVSVNFYDIENDQDNNNGAQNYVAQRKYVEISEPVFFKGLIIKGKNNEKYIQIIGSFDITIIDSIFDGIGLISDVNNSNITIKNLSFKNAPNRGFWCQGGNKLILENTNFKNCGSEGLNIEAFQNARVKNMKIQNCLRYGCVVNRTKIFQIENINVSECDVGILFSSSNGKIKNCTISKCQQWGVKLQFFCDVRFINIQYFLNNPARQFTEGHGCIFLEDD